MTDISYLHSVVS